MLAKIETPVLDNVDGVDPRTKVFVLMLLLDKITNFVLSGDMWWLAWHQVESVCAETGISKEDFEKIHKQFNEFRVARKRNNPMSCLHEKE